jgi:two-component system response regulator ResD
MARILVVDDEPEVRYLMGVTLRMAGYQVSEASGGEEALHMIDRTAFDAVVLDIMMPVTDGYEVLQRLRAMSHRSHTPVIVVSAKVYDAEGMLREASGGVVDHIAKPFDPADLEAAVARVLEASSDLEVRRRMHSRGAEIFGAISRLRDGDAPKARRRS